MKKVLAQLCESNLAFFANTVLDGPADPPFNKTFLIGQHHETWSNLVNKHDQLCILAPRGHGKSHFFTVAYALWMLSRPDGGDGLIISGSDDQARDQLAKIKEQIDTNPRLQHLRPLPGASAVGSGKWSEHHIKVANGRELRAKGFMTKIRGGHPRWIVLDDVVNEESAFSDIQREKMTHFFFSVVYNMKHTSKINFVVVGTPQHASDLYGILQKNPEFHFEKFQAITYRDADGKEIKRENFDKKLGHTENALWPEVMPVSELNRIKRTSGELVFARERQCDVVNDDASLFPLSLFRAPEVLVPSVKLGLPADYWDRMGIHTRYIGVDFAISTSVGADFTCLFVVGLDKYGNRWIIDIIRDRGLDFQDQLHMIHEAYNKYQPQMVYMESNQFQRIFGDELIRTSDIPLRQVVTGSEKHSLEKGLPSLRVLLENRKYRIPRGDAASIEKTDIWIEEMRSHTFTRGKVRSTGDHDDTAMACFVAEKAINDSAFSFSFGEDEEDQEAYDEMIRDLYAPDTDPDQDGTVPTAEGRHPRYGGDITGFSDGYGSGTPGEPKINEGSPMAADLLAGLVF